MTPREQWQLDTRRLGRRVLVFDQLDSTSTRAAHLADDDANDGLVILAGAQTAGRGQYGRSWLAQPGTGVLMSVRLFPPPALRRPALLTAWAAVSVCECILQAAGLQANIKWPNDVLVRGRKVCGILIEQGRGTVAGIGLNVNQSAESFAELGLTEAGSLAALAGRTFDVPQVALQLIGQLDAEYDRMWAGDLVALEACWKGRLGLLGRLVSVECAGATHVGRLDDLGFDALGLRLQDGELLRLVPEMVRHVTPLS
jgi:BirA family transcriptional regulator, biotin operon repressor / biotin---[acetyl-CoA-carboxylase] ligase